MPPPIPRPGDDKAKKKSSDQITSSAKKSPPRKVDDDDDDGGGRPAIKRPANEGSNRMLMVGGLGVGGLLLLFCCGGIGIGGFFFMNRTPDAAPKEDVPLAKGPVKDDKDGANKDGANPDGVKDGGNKDRRGDKVDPPFDPFKDAGKKKDPPFDPFKDAGKKKNPPGDLFPKEPPPVKWNVQPDPGPQVVGAPANPAGFFALTGSPEFHYPSTPSSFVAIKQGTFSKPTWHVLDLQNFNVVANINNKLEFTGADIALSPDGKLLAGKGKFTVAATAVNIYATTDGRLVQSIQLDTQASNLLLVDFGENGHLITYKTKGLTGYCEVYNIATGKQVKQFTKQGLVNRKNNIALSPGRKYIAVAESSVVDIYRPLTGEHVGELSMPDVLGMFKAIAFAPDGKELAVLNETFGSSSRLVTWKMADGKIGIEHKFAKDTHTLVQHAFGYKGSILDWIPDGSGWLLYGQMWIDYQSGAPVHTIPYPPNEFRYWPRRMLGTGHVATAGGDFKQQQMGIITLPGAEIAAAVKVARAGGGKVVALPAAKLGVTAGAKTIPAPVGNIAWAAAPDPAPPLKRKLGSQPIQLAGKAESIVALVFSSGDVGQAVVVSAHIPNPLAGEKRFRAERYDLADGKALGACELFSSTSKGPAFPNVLPQPWKAAVSPDGTRLLARHPDDPKRLDVWDLVLGKHLAALNTSDTIDAMAVVDTERVLTSSGGKIIMWKIPECEAIYVAEGYRGALTLSPGRKYIAVSTGSVLTLLDTQTGERKGQFANSGAVPGSCLTGGFSLDGKEFAASVGNPVGGAGIPFMRLTRWNAANGAWVAYCEGNCPDRPLVFAGNHVFAGQYLFDFNLKAQLWMYTTPGPGAFGHGSPDGRLWFASNVQNVGVLNVQTVPDAPALAYAGQIAAGKVRPVVTPGMPIQLNVNGGNDRFRANAQNLIKDWQARGFKIGPGGLTVTLSANEQATGQTVEYQVRKIGDFGKGGTIKVAERQVVCACTIIDPQGFTLYKNDSTFKYPASVNLEGNDYDRQLGEAMWRSAEGFAGFVSLPTNQYRVNGVIETFPKMSQLKGGR